MGKEYKEKKVQPESKLQVYWLEEGQRFLVGGHWSGGKSQSSVNQAFMRNETLSS